MLLILFSPQHHLKPPVRLSHVVYLGYQHQLSSDIDACLKMVCIVEYLMFMLLYQRYRTGINSCPVTNPKKQTLAFAPRTHLFCFLWAER